MKKTIHSRRWSVRLGALSLALSTLGCASTPEAPEIPEQLLGASVDAVAGELAEVARQRIDISSMRVCLREVTEIETDGATPLPAYYGVDDLGYLAEEISGELVLALSSRFNLIDTDLFGAPPQPWGAGDQESASKLAEHFGATHLIVGTISTHWEDVQLKVRLVDAGNWVIVAAARGAVPVEQLSDRSQVALGVLPSAGRPIVPRSSSPAEPTDGSSLASGPVEITVPDSGVAVAEEKTRPTPRSIEPLSSGRKPASYASWKPPKKPASDRTELDLLLHSKSSYGKPVEDYDPKKDASAKPGPAEARFSAMGRNWN